MGLHEIGYKANNVAKLRKACRRGCDWVWILAIQAYSLESTICMVCMPSSSHLELLTL